MHDNGTTFYIVAKKNTLRIGSVAWMYFEIFLMSTKNVSWRKFTISVELLSINVMHDNGTTFYIVAKQQQLSIGSVAWTYFEILLISTTTVSWRKLNISVEELSINVLDL